MANTDTRTPRDLQTRETTQRKAAWVPPTTLPMPNDRPGWVHRWVRMSMVGVADPTNMSSQLREGWEPVKSEDYPELKMTHFGNDKSNGNVEIGGLILCKAPEEIMSQRTDYMNRQTAAQLEAVDNTFLRQNDSRMPINALGNAIERKSTISFGRGK